FTIDAGAPVSTYRSFKASKTGSFRILDCKDWIGTIHLDRESATTTLQNGLLLAEFIFLLCTYHSYETTKERDYGQNTFDTQIFTKLEPEAPGDARNYLLCNVMWIQRAGPLCFRAGVGQIHAD